MSKDALKTHLILFRTKYEFNMIKYCYRETYSCSGCIQELFLYKLRFFSKY